MTMTMCKACRFIRDVALEITALGTIIVLIVWWAQTYQPVVELLEPPQVMSVTRGYVEVRWNARLVTDCPGRVYPSFVAMYGSESLPDYPFVVEHQPKVFTRRYPIPDYLVRLHDIHHAFLSDKTHIELRIEMVAKCNPLWETRQWLRVPFEIPLRD